MKAAWFFAHVAASVVSGALLGTLIFRVIRDGQFVSHNSGLTEVMSPRDTIELLLVFGVLLASALRGAFRDYEA